MNPDAAGGGARAYVHMYAVNTQTRAGPGVSRRARDINKKKNEFEKEGP